MKTKVCSKCKIEKPVSEYFKNNAKKAGIRSDCKTCNRKRLYEWRETNRSQYNNYTAMWRAKNPDRQHAMEIKRRYKLSIEEYNRMLVEQSCKCKICGKQHDSFLKRGRLYVDHCHKTGKVRALLCGACNSAIGYLNHDISLAEKAVNYLKIH